MVNTEEFIKRLTILLDFYGLNASVFADKIGVQRSSLSHLLSGRNKPSLDFILKIIEVFPEVDLYWILNGKGVFPKMDTVVNSPIDNQSKRVLPTPIAANESTGNLFSRLDSNLEINEAEIKKTVSNENLSAIASQNEIEKIVVFYKNGTFKNYNPSES